MIENKQDLAKSELIVLVLVFSIGSTSLAAVLDLGVLVPILGVVGFVILLPLSIVFGDRLISAEDETHADPLEELRARYARGEISHEEFERRVDRLVETEGVERRIESNATESIDRLERELE